jgi:hypothetical protein
MELTIFANMLNIFGGSTLLLAMFLLSLGLVILLLLRMPVQIILPIAAILMLIAAPLEPAITSILWLFAGVIVAFFVYSLVRGY